MKKNIVSALLASALIGAPTIHAQSIASGMPGGPNGVVNAPTSLGANAQFSFALDESSAIDMRANRMLSVELTFSGSSAATNAAVTATFANSMDGRTFDPAKTFSIAVTGLGTTTARGSTNFDTYAYPYVVPISITNAIGVTVSNLTLRYGTKNGG